MNILLLLIIILGGNCQSISTKAYYKQTDNRGTYTFTALSSLIAALFFIATSGDGLSFPLELLPWSIGGAVAFGVTTVFNALAISCGSLALTSLIMSYSLILPTVFGIVFLNEPISPWLFAGVALLLISLFMINYKPGKAKISLRWTVYILLAFFANGSGSILQKMQQVHFNSVYNNEYMILLLLLVVLFMTFFILKNEREEFLPIIKRGGIFGVSFGFAGGLVNLLVMILVARMAVSVMFPTISAGSLVVASCLSILLYKEKLSRNQLLGILFGIGAIIFLNLS